MRSGGFAAGGGSRAPYSMAEDARATFAAERARDRAGSFSAQSFAAAGLLAAVFAGTTLAVLLAAAVHPFHYVDAVALIAVAILPAEVALACLYARDHPLAVANTVARVSRNSKFGWLRVLPLVAIVGVWLPANAILYANQAFDRSPAVAQTLVVQRLWARSGKHGTTYFAGVVPMVRPPLRLGSFYADQPIIVRRATWRTLVPGRSTMTLAVHPGRLGLSWYDGRPTVAP